MRVCQGFHFVTHWSWSLAFVSVPLSAPDSKVGKRRTVLIWAEAKQLLSRRKRVRAAGGFSPLPRREVLGLARARSVCVVSGKGGTGKSLCSASLASLLSRRGRTLIMDGDLGVGNAHLLQNVQPEATLVDVVEGRLPLHRAITRCGDRLDLLAGGSGFARVAHLPHVELEILAKGLEQMERSYDYLVVDSAAGLSEQTVGLAAAADLVVLVTTPDITSLTDAYAFLKVLVQVGPARDPLVVINRVQDPAEAEIAMRRIANVASKFLGRSLQFACILPEDRAAFRCTQRRSPVTLSEPDSPLAGALRDLGREVLGQLDQLHPAGLGRTLGRRLA